MRDELKKIKIKRERCDDVIIWQFERNLMAMQVTAHSWV